MKLITLNMMAFCLILTSFSVSAHNPDLSSTLFVEESDGKWVLQTRAALTAFEYEVENKFGKDSYATPEEFQQLVVEHVRQNISIVINGDEEVTLENGIVKLGHETSAAFDVIRKQTLPIESLVIKNSSFENIPRNQSALIILKKGFEKKQFTLDGKNEHRAKFNVTDSKFELIEAESSKNQNSFPWSFVIIGLLGLISIFFGLRHFRKSKHSQKILILN